MSDLAISLYVEILEAALPIALAFGICDLIVGTFLRAAFTGRLKFSAKG